MKEYSVVRIKKRSAEEVEKELNMVALAGWSLIAVSEGMYIFEITRKAPRRKQIK